MRKTLAFKHLQLNYGCENWFRSYYFFFVVVVFCMKYSLMCILYIYDILVVLKTVALQHNFFFFLVKIFDTSSTL